MTIENTYRLLDEEKMPLPRATLHGAAEIAVPTLVSTLAISCVFTSVVFLEGPAKYLFTPLGLAVVFAMLASYGLSRTLTPITIGQLLKGQQHGGSPGDPGSGFFARFHASFERGFEHLRQGYVGLLTTLLTRRAIVPILVMLVLALGAVMFTFVGRDFYPAIDGGMIQLHVRAPPGTRIEVTEQIFQAVEDKIRQVIPKQDLDLIVDNFGVPARSYNWAFADGTSIAVNDGVIMVSLKDGHAPTADYVRQLREVLPAAFPADLFYFQPADMATQILNFGLTAQIDVRTVGYDRVKNLHVAEEMRRRIAAIPGVVDAHIQQEVYAPDFYVRIDRARALQFGITVSDIGNNISTSLSSSEQVQPNFWTDPTNGIPYYIAVQTPQYLVSSLGDLGNTPVSTGTSHAGNATGSRTARQCGDLRVGEHDHRVAGDATGPGRAQQCGDLHARLGAGQRKPGQHSAGLRSLCQHPRPRSRQHRDRHRQDHDRPQETARARQHDPGDRPDRQHEPGLSRHDDRPACSRLSSSTC